MKFKRLALPVLVAVLAINLVVGTQLYSQALRDDRNAQESAYGNVQLLTRIMEIIRQDYVDESRSSYKDLTQSALRGMLATLDPHSQFLDAEAYANLQKDTAGQFGGLGIIVGSRDNVLTIIAPIEDTPASRAGILAGDRILKIDGKSTEKWTVDDAVKVLRGQPGEKITLTLQRPTTRVIRDVTLERAIIKVASVKDINNRGVANEKSFPLGADKIGYIRITQFNQPTAQDFETALRKLESQGMEALVIDLRNNPGGLLDSAREIVSKFVPENTLVVYTEGRRPSQRIEYRATRGNKHPNYPIVVLINLGSASASEIVAGALQDLKRAIVVGETSFGKGSVQSIIPLKDAEGRDCGLRLTTSKYYTPSKRVIHENGIVPDITVALTEEDERKLTEWRNRIPDELQAEDFKPEAAPRDAQMERALDVLKALRIFEKQDKAKAAKK
jgi:carboxyl-terminal processing protease